MTILLDNDLEQRINAKLAAGEYPSANDLLRESLRLLEERDAGDVQLRDRWRQEIALGAQQLREGRSVVLDEDTLEGIKARGRARLAQQLQQEKL